MREHPWARDVAITMNFEARGTTGRSLMFETSVGNLDVARQLATLNDVTASSLRVTINRSLPNDTDLSELSMLGARALNFAFVDGVERYHTFHDDITHRDAGSLQHHGTQLLALTKTFGNGPPPRPVTGDPIFFDGPFAGVLAYPASYSVPIALVVAAAVIALAASDTVSVGCAQRHIVAREAKSDSGSNNWLALYRTSAPICSDRSIARVVGECS